MDARLIYNPTAGPRNVRSDLERLCSFFERQEWTVELRLTEQPGDAARMARQAAADCLDAVIVAGGDGTINEVVNGLMGSETALGVLPVGTGNLWAKELRVPTYTLANPWRLREAARGLVAGSVRTIDVGVADGHAFLCWASAGLDAQVTTEMEPRDRTTKRLGALPYLIAATLVAQGFKGVPTTIALDGYVVRGRSLLVMVSNIKQYGGLVEVAPGAKLDDGLLDVFVFEGLGFGYIVRHLLRVLSQRYLDDPKIVHRQAQRIEIEADVAMPVQVDGDPLGKTPTQVRVSPGALRIVAPPTMPADLLTEAM
ncbi:MAG: diacylglycerol kinase family lipid kinase [Anaerolineae bacterium]|jgi:YegS/Rv2252/BmrU family lipid kinase